MNIKNIWAAIAQSPTSVKLLTFIVILIWFIPFIMVIAGLIFFLEKPGIALEAKPSAITPVITLEPDSGPVGTKVTVYGEGWPAGQMVFIRLMAPTETEIPTYAAASAISDQTGHFNTEFVFPTESHWDGQPGALVIAQTGEGEQTTGANFTLLGQMSPPQEWPSVTETEEPTVTPKVSETEVPTATPEINETEESTVTVEPTPTPTLVIQPATATSLPILPSLTSITDLNVRDGPGIGYAIVGVLKTGQTAEVTGLSLDGGWWQIKFSGTADGYGWVSARYTTTQNVSNVPVVQAPPLPVISTPTATPLPTSPPPPVITDWRGEYFNNRELYGAPVLVRNDVTVDFNWGAGSPALGVPADNFSARWTRSWNFSEGTHRLHIIVDDGVRLYVDESLVIDSWQDGGWRELSGDRWLWGGNHTLRIEYYEHNGDAVIKAWAEKVSAAEAPEADFDVNRRSGNVPLRVKFDNDSHGDYDRCQWKFGDDHDSDDCGNPRHTYREAGRYTVKLKIWGLGGSDSKKREDYITVRPVAQFEASPSSGPKPLTVNFINQSTSHNLSEWDFGDDQTSTQPNPTHTYTSAGIYTVRLRVKEAGVWSDYQTKFNFITVTEPPPAAAFTAIPTSGPVPLNVQFTDQSSGVISAWLWDFGDGASGSTEQNPSHIYSGPGLYPVSLTVTDAEGRTNTLTRPDYITVIETNQPPQVTNPGSQNNTEGDMISLPIVAIDPDGDVLSYSAINLPPDLSINSDSGLISGSLSGEAAANSPYTVSVTVSDGNTSVDIEFEWAISTLSEPNRVPEPSTPTPEPPTSTPTPIPPTFTPTPEPPTSTPISPTSTPEPPTSTLEPPTVTPEPPAPTPEPPTPIPPTSTPEPPTSTPIPPTFTPVPPVPAPEPPTPMPVPPTLPPEPPSVTPEAPTLTPTSEPLPMEG